MDNIDQLIRELGTCFLESSRILVFTGAGISTESGISDYRSKGGIWERFAPVTIQEFVADKEKRKLYWQRKYDLLSSLQDAQPNAGHLQIVELEKLGKLRGLITQNIDGLHQLAGIRSEKLLELHGTNRETICLGCGDVRPWQDVFKILQSGIEIPLCEKCGGLLKPNTISFGQSLDQSVLRDAFDWARDCDLLLAVGSTLVVEPASSIPRVAKEQGARLVILTLSETPLDDVADLKIRAGAGNVLTSAIQFVKKYA